ncbi:Bug family tripartite tricarboxylate transporter substrate binding protein [Nosocomiicoccus ampullae]|uniref:Bug family tripartite tricarboxylate transporter substrate binding protein n=1 Tax=Nosocomiicoccus ampullae TaxID=489910 RepID=UPI00254F8AB5|nr:tripartite tricarboxylate transporter substrate-binding protein [Nosocomiicoccus ampullae]MDK6862811.1 tripartite tricarboxylate transporter substrate-binding protein [Nosocomiicoccus ampullae]
MKFRWMILLMSLVAVVLGACSSDAKDEYPNKNIEIIAPATPGGGWDATARAIQNVLDKEGIVEQNMNVVNKPGGGGEVGWQYLKNKDSHHLSVNSSLVIANNLLGQSELTYNDFTPLAVLATEWIAVAVPNGSDIEGGIDLLDRLKEDPSSLTIAVGPALGNNDHLSFINVAEEYGVDVSKLRFMVYESGGDVLTALLGGHVDLATFSLSEAQEQHEAGNIRVIATTADETIDGMESWQDQGIDFSFPHWRGLMGPPNMTEEEIAYWDDAIQQMVKSDGWKTVLENNGWNDYYMDSKETKKFLDEKNAMYEDLIEKSGLGK